MAKNKTQVTDASVQAYLTARASAAQQDDCRTLMAMMQRVTGAPPQMWGASIVGFGRYDYVYESGRSGSSCLTGFAVRGRELVVYLMADGAQQSSLLAKLGTHKLGKACLYFKRLADLNAAVLEQLVAGSVAMLRQRHG